MFLNNAVDVLPVNIVSEFHVEKIPAPHVAVLLRNGTVKLSVNKMLQWCSFSTTLLL